MNQFLSCDWGTSSFRLWWVHDGGMAGGIPNGQGVRSIYESSAGAEGFASYLRTHLGLLRALNPDLKQVPLVISGMASSTIGWKELPYAKAPFALDGSGLLVKRLDWDAPKWLGPTLLVSGVATEKEVMRGEECQVIGIMANPRAAAFAEKALIILPGTHSKHIWVDQKHVVSFDTYMTGEVYEILRKHSILRATTDSVTATFEYPNDFADGVRSSLNPGLAASFFQARTRGVLANKGPGENAAFLSGLLIGAELANVVRSTDRRIFLAASDPLLRLYELARNALGLSWISLSAAELDQATIAAHCLILKKFL